MPGKVILISPGQPALNPRLVKEADALTNAGYNVIVLFAYWNNWGDIFTKELLATKKWSAICVGGHPDNTPFTYLISKILYTSARLIVKLFGPVNYFAALAANRSSFFLIKTAKKYKADLYIAHYLGALPAATKAAKQHNAKCGFDAEDFHRQEVSDDNASFNYRLSKHIEDRHIKKVDYITTSSPLISDIYQQLYPAKAPVTLLNVFPQNKSIKQPVFNNKSVLKLLWFSQTIGVNRGLEYVALALRKLKPAYFELHLLGYIDDNEKEIFLADVFGNQPNIFIHDPVPPDKLVDFASAFDIGLASEQTTPFNRDICLTNKIFTYLQAGLAIIASDTAAQKQLLQDNPGIGEIYKATDTGSLTAILYNYYQDRELLLQNQKAALKAANEKLNWENESKKFLTLTHITLN